MEERPDRRWPSDATSAVARRLLRQDRQAGPDAGSPESPSVPVCAARGFAACFRFRGVLSGDWWDRRRRRWNAKLNTKIKLHKPMAAGWSVRSCFRWFWKRGFQNFERGFQYLREDFKIFWKFCRSVGLKPIRVKCFVNPCEWSVGLI